MIRGATFLGMLLLGCAALTPAFAGQGPFPGGQEDTSLTGSSLCLSCHDGSTARNRHAPDIFPWNSHPLGVIYPVSSGFRPQLEAEQRGVVIVEQMVECQSCHYPHNMGPMGGTGGQMNQPFLRIANTGSALCFACHVK
ncbi:MAG: hypothetical protein Q7V00_06740 [Sulfurimicrobium sp.]|nr:hypothetical protein [Sulfurimicrobium sp.]MDP1705918.1 hypothetical protein [Sulfurimicrobium sp.]MDP2198839.1 hypothetical protein [Sulfurimicrobium sp.]MDP3689381.1 hypothetical protein [Sulfurimicrobium sp.]